MSTAGAVQVDDREAGSQFAIFAFLLAAAIVFHQFVLSDTVCSVRGAGAQPARVSPTSP